MLNSIAPKELPVYFCYLFIVYPLQAYVCIGLMFISVYFIVKTIKQYRETRQTGQKIFNVRMVYFLILAFISTYLIKLLASSAAFWLQQLWPNYLSQKSHFNSIFSICIFVLDIGGFFLFQNALLMVSYNWIANMVLIFENMLGAQQSKIYTKSQRRFLFLVKFCFVLGIFKFVVFPLAIIIDPRDQEQIVQMLIIVLLFQQLLISFIFMLGICLVRGNKKLAQLLDQFESTKMKLKYRVLIMLLVIRFLFGVIFWLEYFSTTHFFKYTCLINQSEKDIFMVAFSTTYELYTSYLIIWFVLFLYRKQKTLYQIGNSTDSYVTFNQNNIQNQDIIMTSIN